MMSDSDREMIADNLRALFAAHWPAGTAVERSQEPAEVARVWAELVAQGFDQPGVPDGLGLEAGVIILREAGRANCPAPLIPAISANLLGLEAGDAIIATALDADGAVFRDGAVSGRIPFVEHSALANRIAVAVPGGIALTDLAGAAIAATQGFAVPALATVTLDAAPAVFMATDKLQDVTLAERLLLTARALGAVDRAFAMVLDHVQSRVQFGQPLARFQSMQHKLADCRLVIDSTALLIADAAQRHDSGAVDWRFSANAAIAYAAGLRKVSLEIHHAFGAIGYAEEHEAPRHFRRAHADLLRMGGARAARAELAGPLIDGSGTLPERELDADVEVFRTDLRQWLADNWTDADRAKQRARPFHLRGRNERIERALGAAGYLSLGWPEALGGKAARPLMQMVLMEELERAHVAASGISAAAWLLAPEIIRHGTPFQQQELLPRIARGEIKFALGYSEPEAGSDLTSLRTRAVRDGDDYVITGQKLWGTGTEHATHIAVAVRTDPDAPSKAKGISVLIVPADLPGITIQPGMALYGHTFCTQFFDEVRVPAHYLLGEENKGWVVLTGALAAERILMGGQIASVARVFEEFCAHVAATPHLAGDTVVRDMVGRYAAEFEAARQLSLRSVLTLEQGRLPVVEGAITKIFSGELAERFAEDALEVLGTAGTLREDSPEAPIDGQIEQLLRRSIMLVVGGGAAEIQKTIIAQQGLGLPR
jgi:3-oxo-4-pregnene-20-carboxyl-CoA dehydrogenase beta subunit